MALSKARPSLPPCTVQWLTLDTTGSPPHGRHESTQPRTHHAPKAPHARRHQEHRNWMRRRHWWDVHARFRARRVARAEHGEREPSHRSFLGGHAVSGASRVPGENPRRLCRIQNKGMHVWAHGSHQMYLMIFFSPRL